MNNILVNRINKDITLESLENNLYEIDDNINVVVNIDKVCVNNCTFNLSNNSSLTINKIYNEEVIDEEITINLNGEGSRVNYNFSTLTNNDQKYVININHNNKHTISNVINHGVVINDSKLVFEVNSRVLKGNIGSTLKQESKIIVMDKNNSIIKPNLFIDEYDVDAVHAATIGRFSKEDIFYLESKGISKEEALKLLINGFLNGHIGR